MNESQNAGNPIPGQSQIVPFTGTAAASAEVGANIVRLYASSDCHIRITETGVAATTSDLFLPAGVAEYFTTSAAKVKVSAIQSAVSGNLYISPMA